jgi:glutaredoxin 3
MKEATMKSPAAARSAADTSVTVYSTPTCPYCVMVKQYLTRQGVAFRDVDVSRDITAARDMVQRSGQMGVPVVDIDGQMVIGFDRIRINQMLGLR